ncbi:alpha/beta hydrolase family protein [Haloechinothrix halophila]|uniref:alpha/beta hydrolase family protein n=1 Tax=Haloechinothrix halophila TaxID=1069073 RepID=UPI0005500416|nr:prolyl oligopeptidase family serine peptidase [Haloechinothrix halophila]
MSSIAPYGTWESPITAEMAAAASGAAHWTDFVQSEIAWAQPLTSEGGRVTLLRETPSGVEELVPAPYNVRNRVHEYGGRPWAAVGASIAFTNWDDQRLYLRRADGSIAALTPEPDTPQGLRYADLTAGPGGEIWAVRETITGPKPTDVARDQVAISLDGEIRVLGASHHFLTAPKPSPDGRKAAWLGWDHPDMPWDTAQLCVAEIGADGRFAEHSVLSGGHGVAGVEHGVGNVEHSVLSAGHGVVGVEHGVGNAGRDVAVCQVEWESDDTLLALADPDGWWNLFRIGLDGSRVNLAPVAEEIGGALWQLGYRWFQPLGDGRHAVLRSGGLAVLDERDGTVTGVAATADLPAWSATLAVRDGVVTGVAAGPRTQPTVVAVDVRSETMREVSEPRGERVPDGYLPVPVARRFAGADGVEIPAYVYPPTNPDFAAPDGELPPYVVHVHGGPTSAVSPALSMQLAYFTSRGIGIVAVNYGGSTGYGRRYRERLREQWGVVDVADCATVAEALATAGTADPRRLAIRGGSAGGYTGALSASTTTTYAAATIMFPVIDMLTFASGETHDFESRYLDSMVGPLPEQRQRYIDRSPITHVSSLACPVLLLQGAEDEICPPAQAESFVEPLAGSGIPHAYRCFDGEQHGFRRAETIIEALEAELSFYGQTLGFDPPGVPTLPLRR